MYFACAFENVNLKAGHKKKKTTRKTAQTIESQSQNQKEK